MADIDDFVTALQETSERLCGTPLPTELALAILIRWGGMASPASLAFTRSPELKWAQKTVWGFKHYSRAHCYCSAICGGPTYAKYDSDAAKRVWSQLQATDGVVEEERTRRVTSHLVSVPSQHGATNKRWSIGDHCGTYLLWARMLCAHNTGTRSLVAQRIWSEPPIDDQSQLLSDIYPLRDGATFRSPAQRLGPCLREAWVRDHWRRLIETLQGHAMDTPFDDPSDGWDFYRRAERGEIM